MIPVTQVGNTCWPACVASILEVPLDSLPAWPDPATADPEAFERRAEEWHLWMLRRNLFIDTIYVHEAPNAAPPGYSILNCRVEGFPDELHSLVCQDAEVVWDPNGYNVQRDWNGIIEGRDWQVAGPLEWHIFIVLDPLKPAGVLTSEDCPHLTERMRRAKELFFKLNKRNPPGRPGVSFGAINKQFGKIAAAYCDAPTDEQGEAAVIEALRQIHQHPPVGTLPFTAQAD